MIRVLHVLGSLKRAGAETMVMNYYRAIDREAIQFDFIVHKDPYSSEYGAYRTEIEKLGGKIYVFPEFSGRNAIDLIKRWNMFFSENRDYQVLHSHMRSYASVYIPIARKNGITTILHSHSTSNGKGLQAIAKGIMQYPLRFQADYYMGCSREAGEWLFGKRIANSNRYFMLPNAINIADYRFDLETRSKYRESIGANETTRVYIHVGRFHPAKNHMFLIEVFERLYRNNNNTLLILVGDGELRKEIEKKVSDCGLTDNIKLLGSRNDVPKLLQAADAFLFPSKWEGLPVTVVEAQAAGLPTYVSETVTRDVNISPLIEYIPINQGTQIWAETIENSTLRREDVSVEINRNGFDIQSSTEWLTNFYRSVVNEQ